VSIICILFGLWCGLYVFFTHDYQSLLTGFFVLMTIIIIKSLDTVINNTFAINQSLAKVIELLEKEKTTINNET
jgi:hypothetical protein